MQTNVPPLLDNVTRMQNLADYSKRLEYLKKILLLVWKDKLQHSEL